MTSGEPEAPPALRSPALQPGRSETRFPAPHHPTRPTSGSSRRHTGQLGRPSSLQGDRPWVETMSHQTPTSLLPIGAPSSLKRWALGPLSPGAARDYATMRWLPHGGAATSRQRRQRTHTDVPWQLFRRLLVSWNAARPMSLAQPGDELAPAGVAADHRGPSILIGSFLPAGPRQIPLTCPAP